MTAFVILHYRAIDTTRSCVKSIRALAGDKHIVIVDNASPDGTGKQLAEEFAASPDVTVLLHGKNDGFARGNNVGVRWVCAHLDADFTVRFFSVIIHPTAPYANNGHENKENATSPESFITNDSGFVLQQEADMHIVSLWSAPFNIRRSRCSYKNTKRLNLFFRTDF